LPRCWHLEQALTKQLQLAHLQRACMHSFAQLFADCLRSLNLPFVTDVPYNDLHAPAIECQLIAIGPL